MDQIKIENLEIFANHGVYPEENRLGQKFLVSCILYVDTRKAGKTDDLEASVNYGTISHLIKEKMEEKNYRLIEAVAEQLAEEILSPIFDPSAINASFQQRSIFTETVSSGSPTGAHGFFTSTMTFRIFSSNNKISSASCSATASISL